MKKYIVPILVASVFLMGAPFAVQQASASDMSMRSFINLLIAIGVIAPDKIPTINAWLASYDNSNSTPTPVTPDNSASLPDLKIKSVDCRPDSPKIGELIYCDVAVYNNSSVYISRSFSVNIQGSLVHIDSLGAHEVKTAVAKYPFSFSTAGSFQLNFIVDAENTIAESNESNNGFAKTLDIQNSQPTLSITSVQSPAEDPNILHPGERATVYGNNLDADNISVYIIGKAYDQTVATYNPHYGSIDFTIPNIQDAGGYYLSLKQSGVESNKISVNVVLPIVLKPTITRISAPGADDSEIDAGGRFAIEGTNFSTPDSVYIGDRLVTVTQDSSVIWAVAPSDLASGSNYIYVKNSGGTSNKFIVRVNGI